MKYDYDEALDYALNDTAVNYFQHPNDAAKTQKRYLREGGLFFTGEYKEPRQFWDRLSEVNQHLTYFPWIWTTAGQYRHPVPLNDEELLEILDKARTSDIKKLMLEHGDHVRNYTSPIVFVEKLSQWSSNAQLVKNLEDRE